MTAASSPLDRGPAGRRIADYPQHESVAVTNDELFTVRIAMRELNRIVDKLQAGELEQAVLMRGSKMVAYIRPLR